MALAWLTHSCGGESRAQILQSSTVVCLQPLGTADRLGGAGVGEQRSPHTLEFQLTKNRQLLVFSEVPGWL